MENVLTVIAEYNPIHFGHLYQLEESIKMINPKYKVAIISGNFVQRGEPSMLNKWEKTKIALHYGFDLVIELPTVYAISSAENFASGAVKIASQIGTTHLSFGTEIGDIERLKEFSELVDSTPEFMEKVKEYIAKGFSYPKSQELVIEELFWDEFKGICTPNNILGLEYLRAIDKFTPDITPITVKRNNNYVSSSKIRELIRSYEAIDEYVPDFAQDVLEENQNNGTVVYSLKEFEKEIIYNIRRMSFADFDNVPDVSENMIKKIKKAASICNSTDDLILEIKNKSITQARIQRILLYILLGITKNDMSISKNVIPYIRVLGMSKDGKQLLSSVSNKNHDIVTSVKSYEGRCNNSALRSLLDIDKFATDVYTLSYEKNSKANLDYTSRVIDWF